MENKDTIVDKLLCMACLCVGRSLHNITDDKMKQFYLGALNEIPLCDLPQVCPNICWECETLLRKGVAFKEQVKDSYRILQTYTNENLYECLMTDISRPPRLTIRTNDPINVAPDHEPSNSAEDQPKELQLVYVKDEPVNVQIDWDDRDIDQHSEEDAGCCDIKIVKVETVPTSKTTKKSKKTDKRSKVKKVKKAVSLKDKTKEAPNAAYCATCEVSFSSICSYQRHMKNSLKHVTHQQLRTAYNRAMEKQPDKPEKVTIEPLSSRSGPMEVQEAVASTSATPFAEPKTAAPKTRAQIQREYRQRIAASKTPAQAAAAREARNVRDRNNRLRQAANLAIASGSLEATTTSSSRSGEQSNNFQTRSQRQHVEQQSTTTADQPDERVNLTNEPLLPAIRVPVEVQEAVASTSATPFAEPKTAAPKTRAQIQREYRQRIAASKTPAQAAAAREARNVRDRNNRLRQAANLAISSGSLEATTTSSSRSGEQSNNVQTRNQRQHVEQQSTTTADQPDERVNLTNEPLFPAIPVPIEVQEAVAFTAATPFAEAITGCYQRGLYASSRGNGIRAVASAGMARRR